MSRRGRGGGRGRAALSFSVEALGIQPGEALPGPQVQPPPTYPILETNPAPIQPSVDFMSRLRFKIDFLDYYSKFKMDLGDKELTPVYKRKITGEAVKQKTPLEYRWELFPMELRPNAPKRAKVPKEAIAGPSAPRKAANIDELLAALEKAEANRAVIKTEKDEGEENNKNNEEQDEEMFDDSDLEMDEGTDYNQNYFDNGDDYLDEEGDDDGPIY